MPQEDVVLHLGADVLQQHVLAAQDRLNGDVAPGPQVEAVIHLSEGACERQPTDNLSGYPQGTNEGTVPGRRLR